MSLDPPLIKLRIPLNFYLGFNAVMTVSFVPCQNVILSQGFNSNNLTFPFCDFPQKEVVDPPLHPLTNFTP